MNYTPVCTLRCDDAVADISFINEKSLVSGTISGTVTLWDKDIRRAVRYFEGIREAAICVQQKNNNNNKNNNKLLIQRKCGKVELWDIDKENCEVESVMLTGATSFSKIVQVGLNTFLSPASVENHIGLFDWDTGKLEKLWGVGEDRGMLTGLDLYKDFIVSMHETLICFWDKRYESTPVIQWQVPQDIKKNDGVMLSAMCSVGRHLWACCGNGDLWMLKQESSGKLKYRTRHALPCGSSSIAVRNDQKMVAIAGWDKNIYFRNEAGAPTGLIRGHDDGITSICFNDNICATGSKDRKILLWDVTSILSSNNTPVSDSLPSIPLQKYGG